MRQEIDIVAECIGHSGHGPVWRTFADGKLALDACRVPEFDTPRHLIEQGTSPDARFVFRIRGHAVAFRGTLGAAAAMDVHDGAMSFTKFKLLAARGADREAEGPDLPEPA